MFTSSLALTNFSSLKSLPASCWHLLEITSLIFMFVWVPEPVCHTTSGNWLSCLPWTISSQASAINFIFSSERIPHELFVIAAAFFRIAYEWIISIGIEPLGPILKLFLDLSVWAPQSLSEGTFTSPIVSFSILYPIQTLIILQIYI